MGTPSAPALLYLAPAGLPSARALGCGSADRTGTVAPLEPPIWDLGNPPASALLLDSLPLGAHLPARGLGRGRARRLTLPVTVAPLRLHLTATDADFEVVLRCT